MRTINILGATGSIGHSTAAVIRAHPDKFDVRLVSAHRNVDKLAATAKEVGADYATITSENLTNDLKDALQDTDIKVISGLDHLCDFLIEPVDMTVAAIVGMAGLRPLLAAMPNSGAIAIANKEPLVAAGKLVLDRAVKHDTAILPVDSEHNAIFQVFEQQNRQAVRRLILTASGGPFRETPPAEMNNVTPEQAVRHPNWSMGAKISVDSATMMNKALEVIEAHYLFQMPPEQIDVLVHPQSTVHSMVEYADGSILAQLGAPDMCTPIAYTLGFPERIKTPGQRLDITKMSNLTFMPPDPECFPAIPLAYKALKQGQGACLCLNAANEVAVAAFLEGKIKFTDIVVLCRKTLEKADIPDLNSLEDILAFDENVRHLASSFIV